MHLLQFQSVLHSLKSSVFTFSSDVDGHKKVIAFLQEDKIRQNNDLGGARVGIVAKPSAEFVAAILGIWLSGGVAVPLALSYPEAEVLHVMNDSVCPLLPKYFPS